MSGTVALREAQPDWEARQRWPEPSREGNGRMQDIELNQPWPHDGLERVERCPVCESGERKVLYDGLTDRVFFSAPGKWTFYRCQRCGSGYLDPRPTPHTIHLAYRSYFTHTVETEASGSPWRRFRRALGNGYRNHRYGTAGLPATYFGVVLARLVPPIAAMLDGGMRHLPPLTSGGRLLDVGCGNGAFLLRARSAGWTVMGVDTDPEAVRIAHGHGLDVQLGGAEMLDRKAEPFDGITLSHVIEHVHNPLSLLRACYGLLRPGGWIWLETPNMEAYGHQRYGSCWPGLDPPRHLVVFAPSALPAALHKAGFRDIEQLPWRPLCISTFPASEAIAKGLDPSAEPQRSLRVLWRSCLADAAAVRRPARREYLTFRARRLG